MAELEIERLPATIAHPPMGRPEMTQDNSFATAELEELASRIFLWSQDPAAPLPRLPLLSTPRFQERYGRAFGPEGYLERLAVQLSGLYPVCERLFRAEPRRCFETCCTAGSIHPKPLAERVYWKRELCRTETGEWLPGYCGVLDQRAWQADPLRPEYERELCMRTGYLFARAAQMARYPAMLFYTATGWPLAIRVR